MGFMDKVKEQASVAAAVAKDAAQKGQAKVEELQAKRAADGLLRELGLVLFKQRTGREPSSAESDIARLVDALRDYEAEHGSIDDAEGA